MRKASLILITVFMVTTFLLTGVSQGQEEEEDTVIGVIIEIVPEEQIIQVGDRNYIVKTVYLDDGYTETPRIGRFGSLEVESLVEVYEGDKDNEGFWQAEKVILYSGEKKEDILREME